MDTGQKLYGENADWMENPDFKRFPLDNPYRSSRALKNFCEKILKQEKPIQESEESLPECMKVPLANGNPPIFKKIGSAEEGASHIARRVQELKEEGVPFSEILVLYASARIHPELGDMEYPVFLQDYLEEEGILCTWVAKNSESKGNWDCTANRLAVSTIHSVKGLGGGVVFVIGLDRLEHKGLSGEKFDTLAYVACSRARQELHILYGEETEGIQRLKALIL